MISTGSRSNSTDSDYELMQQHPLPPLHQQQSESGVTRGYSINQHSRHQPPQYQAPRPPRPSRVSPNRWRHLHRFSPRNWNRNYAGLQNYREAGGGGEYAVPRIRPDTEGRRYDGFFRASIAEEEEEEGEGEGGLAETAEKSIGNMTIMSDMRDPCCKHCKSILLGLFLVLLLLISLTGLGLALYNKLTRESPSDMGTTCVPWCAVTVTRAAHATNCSLCNTSRECTTELLSTSLSGLTPLKFNCIADSYMPDSSSYMRQSYQNIMFRDEESVYCTCTFSREASNVNCSVVGDYCMNQGQENSTNTSSVYSSTYFTYI